MEFRIVVATSVTGLILLLFGAVALGDINYPNFSSTDGLVLNGSAARVGNRLRLSGISNQGAGSAWYSTKQNVGAGFTTSFQFNIFGEGGDGLAFVIQNAGTSALGAPGRGIGYSSIANSVAVEWDTWFNGADGNRDPSNNHISVQTRGIQPNSDDHFYSRGSYNDFANDFQIGIRNVRIDYIPGTLQIFFENSTTTPTLEVPLDIRSTLNLDGDMAVVGFTSATGFGIEDHDILNWTFTQIPEPSGLALSAIGVALIVSLGRKMKAIRLRSKNSQCPLA